VIAEFLKLAFVFLQKHHFQKSDFFQSGGMPSGHATAVSALCVAVFWKSGSDSAVFAVAVIFALLVLYDALKLRRAAGRHAAALNHLLKKKHFNERLGHTFPEIVAGIFLGSGIAFWILF